MKFDPKSIRTFRFLDFTWEEEKGLAKFHYAFDDQFFFCEEISFPEIPRALSSSQKEALDLCLHHLHLVAGVSYYKAAIPPEITIERKKQVSSLSASFLEKMYLQGLGEFAYQNKVNLKERLKFPFDPKCQDMPHSLALPRLTSVPIGGGKDSIVTTEILRKIGEPMTLFSVGYPKAIQRVVEKSNCQHIRVNRRLDPLLFELNEQGAYNGHVPISGIIAFILAASSVIYGFDRVAMSNERSANEGNLSYEGLEVNHQYSKSLAFERDVQEHFQRALLKNFEYFSFLRPLSELAIARLFSRFSSYHSTFTSCNKAFRIHKERFDHWCLDCPKCRFVFLILTPFLEKKEILSIFGSNLLNQEDQSEGFAHLMGIDGHKPFECVGELEEVTAVFRYLSEHEEWKNDTLVQRFQENWAKKLPPLETSIESLLVPSSEHLLSPDYEEKLYANL